MVATAFELPAVDDGDEVELAAWLVEEGDAVSEGQPIAEVETEKSVIEIEVPYDATVSELLVEEWTVVSTGEEIAVFEVDEDALAESADDTPADDSEADDSEADAEDQPPDVETPEGRVFAPPRVRRLARELGVDITAVEGSDHGGRITEEDVRNAAEDSESDDSGPKPFTPSGKSAVSKGGKSVSDAGLSKADDDTGPKPFTPSGKSAVSKAGESVSGAGLTDEPTASESGDVQTFYDTATVDHLVGLDEEIEAGILPFVLKALSRACDAYDVDGAQIGLGVRTTDNLDLSVVSVDERTFGEVDQQTVEKIEAGESGLVDGGDEQPAVVVTEPGALGRAYATPPLNGATVAVALGALEARPVVEDGDIVARETLPVSVAVSDAVGPTDGGALTARLIESLESPSRLLAEST